MNKLSVFAYESPVRKSPRYLKNEGKSPIEINRLESLLERETEVTIIESPEKLSKSKSASKKRSIVCVLKDGTRIKLCSTCAGKNKGAVEIVEQEAKRATTRKKVAGDSETQFSIVTRNNKKFTEDAVSIIDNNNATNDTSTMSTRSKKNKKNANDQSNSETSEYDKAVQRRTTRKRKETVDLIEDSPDAISQQEINVVQSSRVQTRKAAKDASMKNQSIDRDVTNVMTSTTNKEISMSSINPTDSLIITRQKAKLLSSDSDSHNEIMGENLMFNSTAINEEIKQELMSTEDENEDSMDGLHNLDITFEGITFDSRADSSKENSKDDSLKTSKKRVQFEQEMNTEAIAESLSKKPKKEKGKSSAYTKSSSTNEIYQVQDELDTSESSNDVNRGNMTLIEEVRCQCGLIEGTLNLSKLALKSTENAKRNQKGAKSKAAKTNRVIVKSEPVSSDEDPMPSTSSMIKEESQISTRSKTKSTKKSSKLNKSKADLSNITLRSQTKKHKHKMNLGHHRAEVKLSNSECDSSCSCWESGSSDCECYNCTLTLDAALKVEKSDESPIKIPSVKRKGVKKPRVSSSSGSTELNSSGDYDEDDDGTCCCRQSHRRCVAMKGYNLRSRKK